MGERIRRRAAPRRAARPRHLEDHCRADAVDPVLFARMRDAGLFMVYMGLESGSEEGLTTLHKQITVEENLRTVEILKNLGLMFEFGFMLFDPSTTFESVVDSRNFLRTIVGDGAAPATFCRMIPYDRTPIKDTLLRTGRFKGDICHPEYDFLDPRVDSFFHALNEMVHVSGWIHGIGALTVQLQYAKGEVAAMEALFPPLPGLMEYKETLRRITASANQLLFGIVEDVLREHRDGVASRWTPQGVRDACVGFQEQFLEERDAFVLHSKEILLRALGQPGTSEAAHA
jgi:hypothetical protein